MSLHELEPGVETVLQEEAPAPLPMETVPVRIEGPLRTQPLPRKSAAGRTVTITSTPVRLLLADPHRASAILMATGTGNIQIGFSVSAFSGDAAATVIWPAGSSFTCNANTEIWVAQPAGSSVTQVSYYRENWAQG